MKTSLFLIVLLCSYCVSISQDSHQSPSGMTFSQRQLVDSNQQSKFFYSWNWLDGPQALNYRYQMNAFHTFDVFNNKWSFPNQPTSYNTMPDSLKLMRRMFKACDDSSSLDAMAMV